DGSLDEDFGDGGRVITDFHVFNAIGQSVLVQPDGKIVAAGLATVGTLRFAVARYHADGSLDEDFGSRGLVTPAFGRAAAPPTDGSGRLMAGTPESRILSESARPARLAVDSDTCAAGAARSSWRKTSRIGRVDKFLVTPVVRDCIEAVELLKKTDEPGR